MSALTFQKAREVVERTVRDLRRPKTESLPLEQARGRVLAQDCASDRNYPPFNRSARDGFAVRSQDIAEVPARLKLIGETRAGEPSKFTLGPGEAVEIMTGAPGPAGADCVVMVERSRREGDDVILEESLPPGRNLVYEGSEAQQGATLLSAGVELDYPQIALLASIGKQMVSVYKRPSVAILSTGDEVIPLDRAPEPFQIRNSNAYSLAAQVARRGGEPRVLPVAPDLLDQTRSSIERGLESDILLLSGGVSMGKYDLVEQVLSDLGAKLHFTRVLIQPGKPLVFGQVGDKPIFGLPGNPISTMVTFEIFGRIALELLAGRSESPLPFVRARLANDFSHKPVLTRFLPARLEGDYERAEVRRIEWQGSGDLASITQSNCYLVASNERESWQSGEEIEVLPH